MRKWFVFLMTAIGMTLFIMLGHVELSSVETPRQNGEAAFAEEGKKYESAAAEIVLKAVVSMEEEPFAALQDMKGRFEQLHPNVSVDLLNVSRQKLFSSYRARTGTEEGPDILMYPTAWVRHEAAEGRLMALDKFITVERQSRWFNPVRGAVRWNGYLWGMPFNWDPYVFVFDARLQRGADQGQPATVTEWLRLTDGGKDMSAAAGYGEALLNDWTAKDTPEAQPLAAGGRAPLEAVVQGTAELALVTLQETLQFSGDRDAPELSVAAFIPDEQPSAGALPPFAGSSFVVASATAYPQEAANWIQFVADNGTNSFSPLLEGRLPVDRTRYDLPSSLGEGDDPLRLNRLSGGKVAVSLKEQGADEAQSALRPYMQLIDGVIVNYGAPSKLFADK